MTVCVFVLYRRPHCWTFSAQIWHGGPNLPQGGYRIHFVAEPRPPGLGALNTGAWGLCRPTVCFWEKCLHFWEENSIKCPAWEYFWPSPYEAYQVSPTTFITIIIIKVWLMRDMWYVRQLWCHETTGLSWRHQQLTIQLKIGTIINAIGPNRAPLDYSWQH